MSKKCILISLLISIPLWAILLTPLWVWGATFYVDCNADGDAGTGLTTAANVAWKTVAKVNSSSFSAGDTVSFNKTCTWREQLTVPSSGTSGSPVTFGAYGTGAAPIINGSDIITSWTVEEMGEETGGVFSSGYEDETNAFTTDFTGFAVTGTNTLTVSTEAEQNGAKGMRMTFDGSTKGAYAYKTVSDQTDVYARVYFRFNSYFLPTDYQKLWFLNLKDGANNMISIGLARADATTYKIVSNIRKPSDIGLLSFAASPTLTLGAWHRVEVHFKQHASEGGYEIWVDGVSKASNFVLNTSALAVDSVVIGANDLDADGPTIPAEASTFDIDDIKVDTAPIGTSSMGHYNVWNSAVTNASGVQAVYFDNVIGNEKANKAAIANAYDWYWEGDVLSVYGTADPNVTYTAPGVEATSRISAITIDNKSYITVQDIELTKSNVYGNLYVGTDVAATSGITIQRITSSFAREHGIHIQNNHATLKTTNFLIDSCIVHDNGKSGINISNGVNSGTISNNTVYANTWANEQFQAGIRTWGNLVDNNSIIIEDNTVYGQVNGMGAGVYWTSGNGIHIDQAGGTPTPIVRRNKVYDNAQHGIFVENSEGVQVSYNLCYGNGINPTGYSAGIFIYRDAGHNEVYNNVCYGNNDGGITVRGAWEGETGMIGNLVKNNICLANTTYQLMAVKGGENDGTMGSGNVYLNNSFGAEAANFIQWGWAVTKSTYDAWETAYGGTTSSVESDPLFMSTSDFRLRPASPAINAGVDVGLTEDYAGNFIRDDPDLGAYEAVGGVLTLIPSGGAVITLVPSL